MQQTGRSPWLILEPNKWADLVEYGQVKHYPKDSIIVDFGTVVKKLYYVLEGDVKYSLVDQDGQEKVITIVGRGVLFGEGPIFTKEPTCICAIAANDCHVCELRYDRVMEFLQRRPELAVEIITSMSCKFQIMLNQLADLSFKCSEGRVASLIYRLAVDHGIKTNEGIRLSLGFTHQELAQLAGCSRVSVSRVLSALKSKGLIAYSRRYLIVKNLDKLNEIANLTN